MLFHVEVSNDKKGIQAFFRQLKALDQGDSKHSLFCLEHTGIYNNPLLLFLFQKQAAIWVGRRAVEKATQIRESRGVSRTKNDKVEAIKIARYAYKNRPGRRAEDAQLWHPKREVMEQLDGWPLPSLNGYAQTVSQCYSHARSATK